MEYFIGPAEEERKASSFARALGWKGICILAGSGKEAGTAHEKGIELTRGILLQPQKPSDIEKAIDRYRKTTEVLAVKGGDIDINRTAIESVGIDMLISPYTDYSDGMDHVTARLARKNNVHVGFAFSGLLHSARQTRADIFACMCSVASLVRKYKAPFVLASFGESAYDIRSPSDMLSFGRLLGFDDRRIKESMSGGIARENRKRLSGKWIMPGVEKE